MASKAIYIVRFDSQIEDAAQALIEEASNLATRLGRADAITT
jgi:hypothetical protein